MASEFPVGGKIGEFLYTSFLAQEEPSEEMQTKSVNLENLIKTIFVRRKSYETGS